MYDYETVINTVARFIDEEILIKIGGWQKWIIGAGTSIALSKGTTIFNDLKINPIIKSMEIIDKDNKIDVELLYKELKKQAKKSAITFDVPLLGPLTLNEQDLDKLYQFIREKK